MCHGMTHNPEGCSYSAFPLSITHFIISVTIGKDMSVERKSLMTKTCSECLQTRIMGTSHELNEIPSAVSLFLHYTLFTVL
jgi:hypothetical protein